MAQIYRRRGGEILVNTETANNQTSASLAVTADGGFVVVWTDGSLIGGDSSVTSIKAQRFDSDGNKIGLEFLVNTTTAASQGTPTVAVLASGRFVVTWGDLSLTGGDTSSIAVRGQLFEANGTPVGGEFLVNTATTNAQQSPVVTALAGGGFVASWTDASATGGDSSGLSVKAQLFDSNGAKVGGEILVNTTVIGGQNGPAIIPLGTGFAIAWNGAGGSNGGLIQFQRFDSAGLPVGTEQVVTPTEFRFMGGANIAAVDGGFVVVWTRSDALQAAGPSINDIRAQLYDANGVKVGGEILVNATTVGNQFLPDVDGLPGGGFIVTWQGPGATGEGSNVYGQVFDSAGAKVGIEFVLSSSPDGEQGTARVEVLPSGDLVVTWSDDRDDFGDTSGFGIVAQVLTLELDAPTDIDLSNTTLSETTIDNLAVATLSATGALNTSFTYEIVSDSTGGAFRIEGDRLVVDDNDRLDFETEPSIDLRIRATDLNGNSYEENITLTVTDAAVERRYSAGDEFVVPAETDGAEGDPTVVALAGGGFLMAWKPDEFAGTVNGRLFDSSGAPLGDEFEIAAPVFSLDFSLSALSTGGFVAVYMSPGFPNQVTARIFDDTGAQIGDPIVASNDANLNGDVFPDVALLDSGNFVITWTIPENGMGDPLASTIRARIFDASGAPLGDAFDVNAPAANQKGNAQVAGLADGGFVVVWGALSNDGEDIKVQRFDADGDKVGAEFTMEFGASDLEGGDLVGLAGGGFVVAAIAQIGEVSGFPELEVTFQRFDANGDPAGDPVVVGTFVADAGGISDPHLAALPDGGFVITVGGDVDPADGDGDAVVAYIFDSSGQQAGEPFVVNEFTRGDQDSPDVAVLETGEIVFGWLDSFVDDGVAADRISGRIFSIKDDGTIVGTEEADSLNGTAGDDVIQALGGDDVLTGGLGADSLNGGVGTDTANYGDVAAAVTVNLNIGQGFGNHAQGDTYSSIENVIGSSQADFIIGSDDDNRLDGAEGDDTLVGSIGADFLVGGEGSDTASYADNWGGVFINLDLGQGFGNAAQGDAYDSIENLTGSIFDDFFIGTLGDNRLEGGDGNDTLVGSVGADTLVGGNGSDTASYEENWGAVFVNLNIGQGFGNAAQGDTYEGIENVNGSVFDDFIIGDGGSNRLDGTAGDDTLVGSVGADALVGGIGTDTASYEDNWGAVSANLSTGQGFGNAAQGDTYQGIENLTGSIFDDLLIGSEGANRLAGGFGSDTLAGGAGADSFLFNTAVGAGNVDFFTDFVSGTDKILLDHNVFTGLALGALSASVFSGGGNNDGDDRIIFNPGLGFIYFDADGGGPGGGIAFALMQPGGTVTASDFVVI